MKRIVQVVLLLGEPSRKALAPLLVAGLATVVACGGGGSGSFSIPTAPEAPQSIVGLSTAHGSFTVVTNGYPVDLSAVDAAVEQGYAKARDQIGGLADQLRFDGYTLVVMPEDWELYGEHVRQRREIRMRVGVERVVAHELQHVFAWELKRHEYCKAYQDHPGGYDLHCNRLP